MTRRGGGREWPVAIRAPIAAAETRTLLGFGRVPINNQSPGKCRKANALLITGRALVAIAKSCRATRLPMPIPNGAMGNMGLREPTNTSTDPRCLQGPVDKDLIVLATGRLTPLQLSNIPGRSGMRSRQSVRGRSRLYDEGRLPSIERLPSPLTTEGSEVRIKPNSWTNWQPSHRNQAKRVKFRRAVHPGLHSATPRRRSSREGVRPTRSPKKAGG